MRTEQAAALLKKTLIFSEADDATLNALAERAMVRQYKKGQLLFHQGDPGDSLFIVVEGLVKVFVTSDEGDEMVLTTVEPSGTIGELALIDEGPRSASAEVVEASSFLVLTRSMLIELMSDHPAISEALLRSMGALLRRLTEQAADLVFLDLPGRVAKLLVGLVDKAGATEGDTMLDLKLTQTDLASMVGGSRQSVNQILKQFEGRGYLEFQGRKIVVKKPDLLRRRAGA